MASSFALSAATSGGGTCVARRARAPASSIDRKSTRLNSSHSQISYAVFCLKKKIIHSPFEFLLAQLDEDRQREREDHDYLEEPVKLICLTPCSSSRAPFTMTLRKRSLLKPVPIHYTNLILDLREFSRNEFGVASSNGAVRFPGESSPHDFAWDESLCLLRFSMGHAPFLLRNPADYVR